ncbi:hypothetical protein BD289DRAFT_482064 [Coniella lustricola]|uniref:Uncharacterized protein n=1 Tax=Coniella lustricola TaxID=2025994 RepID=A0A2T3AA80_9PEZI|nr:hypothetical protein BD289DRAFT_482064 [Coniella lustricola]
MEKHAEQDKVVPIAIIGMACRFPGEAEDAEALFQMLEKGQSAWSEFPKDRVNIDGFYHPSGTRQGSIGFRGAHFLKGDIRAFDAGFFNISQVEAQAVDPQQRILLEATYQAIENGESIKPIPILHDALTNRITAAGYSKESLSLTETSVNVGTFVKDYEQIVLRDPDWAPQYAATGTGNAILANRISYQFNLRGPSQTIDTGCSASLVAVHNGCQDLRTGRSELAIAAGVGMILTPATMMPMTALNFLGKDGKCYTFTNKAEGYGRGEGVGVVILKRLDDAMRDNDTIRAVIRGSRVNQDGKTPGITMPSADAQLSNIRAVYREAGLDVHQTAYVECHGTGTPAGDPKESFAISQAFCGDRSADKPIYIASIKPNIGHLEGAAGVAGLIKAIMSVEKGSITKNLYFDPSIGNPNIKFEEWKVKVPTELTPWPMEGLRRASVNCFGFGGTNAHVIIDDAGTYLSQRALAGNHHSAPTSPIATGTPTPEKTFIDTQLFLISAHDNDGIARISQGHASYIADHASDPSVLADYAYTLSRRSTLEYKSFIVARSADELAAKLAQPDKLQIHRFTIEDTDAPKVAMIFCGQGAQWYAMGRELMAFEPFRSSLEAISKYLSTLDTSNGSFNLLIELQHSDSASSRIHEPRFAQPATTAIQIALVDLLKTANVSPQAIVGHSSGEIAAAYAAGYLSRKDALLVAFWRGVSASSIATKHPHLKGQMMAVGLSAADAKLYLNEVEAGTVVIACENSPVSVTLSGDEEQILQISRLLAARDIWHKPLAVKTAYHSHHMKLLEKEYLQTISSITPLESGTGVKMFSSVTGKLIDDGTKLDAAYWATNLVSPVLYYQAFSAMYKAVKPKVVVEVSPAVTLSRPSMETVNFINPKRNGLSCVSLLKRNEDASLTALGALGEAWARGVAIDFSWVWTSKQGLLPQLLVDLPPYPFNHSKGYWFESHFGHALRFRKHGREDLIGAPIAETTQHEPRWRGFLRVGENPWLLDHQVQKTVIYPASGLITMALEAARQCRDTSYAVQYYQVSDFTILKPVIIPSSEHGLEHMISTKMIRVPPPDATRCSAMYSFTISTKTEHGHWQENAEGFFSIFYSGRATGRLASASGLTDCMNDIYLSMTADCKEVVSPAGLYERLDGIGMNYGPLFRNVVELSKSKDSCVSMVRIPDTKSKMPAQFEFDHLIHPATLDAMFQTVFALDDATMVPSRIESVTFSPDMVRGAGALFRGFATARRVGYREAAATIIMRDVVDSKPMVAIEGIHFVKLSSDSSSFLNNNRNLCSQISWQELRPVSPPTKGALTINNGNPTLLVLPDGMISESLELLLSHLTQANLELVRLRDLKEQHLRKPCISLIEIDQSIIFRLSQDTFPIIKKLLTLTPGLLWVTQGARGMVAQPSKAPFYGLARTIRSEDSSRRIVALDIGTIAGQHDIALSASAIQDVFNSSFAAAETEDTPEVEYLLKESNLWVARLSPLPALNNVIEKGIDEAVQIESITVQDIQKPVKLKLGHLTDIQSMYFVDDTEALRPLSPDEVRLAILSTQLLPIDLDTAMGKSSETALGADVLGQVTGVGCNVADLVVGDMVVALARDTIRSHIIIDRAYCHFASDPLTLRRISPTALVTAFHALFVVGFGSANYTVFIDCAQGIHGDAFLRIAKYLKATVIAGVRTAEERDFIYTHYGISKNRIVDTTIEQWPESVNFLTGGAGVDMFCTPTSGDLELKAKCISSVGCLFLIENMHGTPLGKSAVMPQNLKSSVIRFDLFALIAAHPGQFVRAWTEVLKMQLSGQLGSCPEELIVDDTIDNLDTLWDRMAAAPGQHVYVSHFWDKSVIRLGTNPIKHVSLQANATYILAGGLGGLGKAIAEMMVIRGARHLLFLSRSGAKTIEDFSFIQLLQKKGVNVTVKAVDICDLKDLKYALKAVVPAGQPIKGIIQCAAVIADAVFETMTFDEWTIATRPKIIGSWNLHTALPDDMDFFISLSSASGVIGNRGQANYAAGNCYQDALAAYRTGRGMHSVSIDLGPVVGAGMLENDEKTYAILKASGFFMVAIQDCLFLVERAMCGSHGGTYELPSQVVTGVGTGGLILQNGVSDPYWADTKMFEVLNAIDLPQPGSDTTASTTKSSQATGRSLTTALKNADNEDDAIKFVLSGCVNYLSASLGMNPDDMDTEKSLAAYGLDSLVTSSFRSWIFKNVGVKITDLEVMGAASIFELARCIVEKFVGAA